MIGWMPAPVRRALARRWERCRHRRSALASKAGVAQPGDKMHKLARLLRTVGDQHDLYGPWFRNGWMAVAGH